MEKETLKSRILLVDDDEMVRGLYEERFSKAGFPIAVLDTVEGDFVAQVKARQPKLILLDIEYANGTQSGFDAAQALRADEATKHIPIILLTNFGRKEDSEKATALGVLGYILKSDVTPHQLVERVETAYSKFIEAQTKK